MRLDFPLQMRVMALLVWSTSASVKNMVCNVADYGAKPDNTTVNTAAFRAAAAACRGKGRPGARAVVLVPLGVWVTGAFNLSSHTELRLELGATVAAVHSVSRTDYPAVSPFPSYGTCRDGQSIDSARPLVYEYEDV